MVIGANIIVLLHIFLSWVYFNRSSSKVDSSNSRITSEQSWSAPVSNIALRPSQSAFKKATAGEKEHQTLRIFSPSQVKLSAK